MKEVRLTSLDSNSIPRYTYNEELKANRVQLVGNDNIIVNLDTKPLEEAIKNGFTSGVLKLDTGSSEKNIQNIEYRTLEVPTIVKEIQIVEIEKPIMTTEIKFIEIEKQIFIPEIRIVEIEKPIIITETKIVEIEKPIIIIKKEYEKIDNKLNYIILIIQTLGIIGLIFKLYLKG